MNIFTKFSNWFSRRVSQNQLKSHEFGVVRFGPDKLPMVPFKHPHIGKVKLFYVDAEVRDRLAPDPEPVGAEDART